MASKRRIRRKKCLNKRRYETREEAFAVILSMRHFGAGYETTTHRLQPYGCRYCGGWHVGHGGRRGR